MEKSVRVGNCVFPADVKEGLEPAATTLVTVILDARSERKP